MGLRGMLGALRSARVVAESRREDHAEDQAVLETVRPGIPDLGPLGTLGDREGQETALKVNLHWRAYKKIHCDGGF